MIGQTIFHYRITRQLGAGGMGVVYEAVDTKLDRTVALKFLPPESVSDPDAKARFIHEAKAASSLDHPNICTIHAIEETSDGRLFIAMASYEGETLKDMIARGPLDFPDVQDIIIQTLQGLAKAHRLGIVHRDIKPANVLVTSEGLVKLLDFGIAKLAGQTHVTKTGSILGTVDYMAPEQLHGEEVDRRADLWSVGVLLYEMITGRLPFTGDHPPAVMYAILNTDPEPMTNTHGDIPSELEAAVARCLDKSPAGRYQGVEELLLNLKPLTQQTMTRPANARTVSLRGEADSLNVQPYPGLASFTEKEVEYFHGRESRVESVWQKLRRGRLLAITGPSGVGKTSFLKAGLIPAKPPDWGIILATPGVSPFLSLRQALVPELAADTGAMKALLSDQDLEATVAGVRRFRDRHDEALLIFDQFEELFTLCPPEEQERVADLLSRLTFEADVHVLVSLRDDFLFHCQEYAGLAPLYESLTVLGPLTGASLRRALVQPALDCGYGFEDETVIDEMVAEVEGERGALPLLAFAMARLWERRDREKGLLTRQAFEDMGAVSGALAQHAESVMDQIGADHHAIVQELFRNLVTAQGTRSVQEREKILSVFESEDQHAAEEILGRLIDARLLTSYEMKGEDGKERHRIEIVHESLLNAWPRLVRWRTRDEDSAQMRDQLRQAAQLWEEKNQTDDLLWTGTAFQEFELWRERYPGGLSSSEESFASAMTERAVRGRRRRRIALTGAFMVLIAVLVVVGGFWRQAEKETRRSEAARLLMLANDLDINADNTLVFAWATASLEEADSPAARHLALKAMSRAPLRRVLIPPDTLISQFSAILGPDGEWLATVNKDGILIWPRDGEEPRSLTCEQPEKEHRTETIDIHPDGRYIVANRIPTDLKERYGKTSQLVTLWSALDGRHLRTWRTPSIYGGGPMVRGDPPFVLARGREEPDLPGKWLRYTLDSDVPEELGSTPSSLFCVDKSGKQVIYAEGNGVYLALLDSLTNPPLLVGRHEYEVINPIFNHDDSLIASLDRAGTMRVWSHRDDGSFKLTFDQSVDEEPAFVVNFDRSSSRLSYARGNAGRIDVIDLTNHQAIPTQLLPRRFMVGATSFTPDDLWLASGWFDERIKGGREYYFYSLAQSRPRLFRYLPDEENLAPEFFLPDGSALIARKNVAELLLCQVETREPDYRELWSNPLGRFETCQPGSNGKYVCVNNWRGDRVVLVPVNGSEPISLDKPQGIMNGMSVEPGGRRVAVSGGQLHPKGLPDEPIIRIHDLETGEEQVLQAEGECGFFGVWFLPGEKLISFSHEGLFLWDLTNGQYEILSDRKYPSFQSDMDAARRFLVVNSPGGVTLWDLQERTERILPLPTEKLNALAISPDARFVVAGMDGNEVLVLHLDSDEPHVLLGHDSWVGAVWISPDSKEIRSASSDGLVCSWEVPDGKPVHTLPYMEFMEVLRSQTNMRVVSDVDAEEGYRIEYDRFPGWETAPDW